MVERHHANFYQNRLNGRCRLQRYGELTDFAEWRPSAILDLLGAYWDRPRWPLGGVYRCAKFGWNRCSKPTVDNMKLNISPVLLEKAYYSRPQNRGLGNFTPKMGSNINGLTCRWVPEKKVQIKNFVIFHPFAQKPPMGGFAPNLAQP